MKKIILFIVILMTLSLGCNIMNNAYLHANQTNHNNEIEIISVELGAFQSLKYFDEGLICKSFDSVYFVKRKEINSDKVIKLQEYINNMQLLENDTTIDDV